MVLLYILIIAFHTKYVIDMDKFKEEIIDFIDKSTSCYTWIEEIKKKLDSYGYIELYEEEWNLDNNKYYVVRNDLYLERIDTLRLEVNDNYIKDFDTEYLYQLNLNASEEENKEVGLSSLVEYDRINKVITSDRIEKYSANLAYFYNLFYNKDEEMSFSGIFMAGLMSKSYTELYNIMSKILLREELNKFMEDVINMTNEELLYNIHYWEKEKMDALVEHTEKEEARKRLEEGIAEGRAEGRAEGKAEGKAEGREEGRIEEKIQIIKKMLNKKTDYNYISEISGKTIEEIKEIEKNMN